MITGNQHFILPRQPEPGDERPRNAFGILLGFGEAAKKYWEEKDRAMLESPTMSQEATTPRYVLSIKPTVNATPRDGLERLARVLDKPVWSQADRDRLARARDGLWEHWNQAVDRLKLWEKHECPEGCRQCAMIERIDPRIAEWDRIAKTPPIPSTAQLRNALRRPDRAVRAARLYRDLMERLDARKRTVLAGLRQYKTPSVRKKHEQAAEDNDPGLRRIHRAIWRLEKIQPDARHLARTLR